MARLRDGMRVIFVLLSLVLCTSATADRRSPHFRVSELGVVAFEVTSQGELSVPVTTVRNGIRFERLVTAQVEFRTVRIRRLGITHTMQSPSIVLWNSGRRERVAAFTVQDKKRIRRPARSYFVFLRDGESPRLRRGPPRISRRGAACNEVFPAHGHWQGYRQRSVTQFLASPAVVLAVDADSRFVKEFGTGSTSAVLFFLSAVKTIYAEQLGVDVRLGGISIFEDRASDPVGNSFSTAVALLEAYRGYVQGEERTADVSQLFTQGRGYLGAIGLAYLGATCLDQEFAVGWNDFAYADLPEYVVTIAHELGHLLGASHDAAAPRSIMGAAGINDTSAPQFSAASRAEIGSFISGFGSCLMDEGGEALSDDSTRPRLPASSNRRRVTVSVGVSGRTLRGAVRLRSGRGLGARPVEIYRYNTATRRGVLQQIVFTSTKGRFSVRVPRGTYYVADRKTRRATFLVTVR